MSDPEYSDNPDFFEESEHSDYSDTEPETEKKTVDPKPVENAPVEKEVTPPEPVPKKPDRMAKAREAKARKAMQRKEIEVNYKKLKDYAKRMKERNKMLKKQLKETTDQNEKKEIKEEIKTNNEIIQNTEAEQQKDTNIPLKNNVSIGDTSVAQNDDSLVKKVENVLNEKLAAPPPKEDKFSKIARKVDTPALAETIRKQSDFSNLLNKWARNKRKDARIKTLVNSQVTAINKQHIELYNRMKKMFDEVTQIENSRKRKVMDYDEDDVIQPPIKTRSVNPFMRSYKRTTSIYD